MAGSVLFLSILGFNSPSKKFDSSMGSALFTGKSVGLGTSKCPKYHGVLSQSSLLQLIERGSPVVIPFNELLLIVGHDTRHTDLSACPMSGLSALAFSHPTASSSEDLSLILIPNSRANSTVHAENHATVNSEEIM